MSRPNRSLPFRKGPPVGRYIGYALAVLLVLFGIGVVTSAFYTVDANEQAVVLRFGRYRGTVEPGAHFRMPFIDQVLKVSTEERTARLPAVEGIHDLAAPLPEDQTLMLTGDLNAATVEWTVQWRVRDAKDFLFAFYDRNDDVVFDRVFQTAAQSTMNRLIGDYSVDEVLTDKRTEVAEKARAATQKILDDYECGVLITDLQMQRVTPPERVKPAFDAVNASIQERDRLENEANKLRNEILPKAKADRDKLIREAQGYADRRRAEVEGEVTALKAKYDAYKLAPEQTRRRLYLEALQDVLGGVDQKVILDSDLKNMLPVLPLGADAGR